MTATSTTEVRTYLQSDGYRTHYRQWGPDNGQDVVVMLHGGMSHAGWQEPLGAALVAAAPVTFIAVDRRGSGLNDRRGHIPSPEQVLTDLAELLRDLNGRYHRIHLAGWCFGGQVATAVAGRLADQGLITSLILVAPGFFFNERYSDVLRLSIESAQAAVEEFELRPDPARPYVKVPLEPADFTTRPQWREFIERDELKLTLVSDGTVTAWEELAHIAEREFARLGDLPVLAVLAGGDRLVDNPRVREFLSDRKQITIADVSTGHAVHFEGLDTLTGLILSFIRAE